MFREAFCVLRMCSEPFYVSDRLYFVTDVSNGDGKGVIFLSFASSLYGVNNFVQEKLFILTIFTL